jgi:TonB-linked SusC/RagA family outer membrane protein
MRKLFLAWAVGLLLCSTVVAQSRVITGTVIDEKGVPLPNVSVMLRNSNIGTTTDLDGKFRLEVPSSAKTLLFTSVGLGEMEVPITDKTNIAVTLSPKGNTLSEVVVTSLGIVRDKRSLGYATQTLKSDQLVDKGQVNVVGALQGKVSGVSITGASGAAGASYNINIRGISSFTKSNQPLFIVDGIPISNDVDRTNGGPLGTLGDNQPANRALDIDLNNIESVNIMKGPSAAALYGSRAAAGAIIITTKKGGNARGKAEIILNSSYSNQTAIGLPEVQNQYGQGLGGVYNPTSTSSWGPAFSATPTIANGLIVGGVVQNYKAYPNNIKDFFETGNIWDNSLSINGGDLKQNYTLSVGYLDQKGILPNTSLKRTNVKFGGNTVLRDKIKIGGSAAFTNTLQDGILGGNGQSSLGILAGLARSIDLTSYKVNGTWKNPDGSNNFVIPNTENPYFGAYENPLTSNLYRITGNITAGIDITKWLNVMYRLGVDAYTDRRKQVFAVGSGRVPAGQDLENTIFRSEVNGDLIITAKRSDVFTKDLGLTALVGQNINQRLFQSVQAQGDNLTIPGYYNLNNATVFTNGTNEATTKQRLVGFYAQLSWDYKSYLYLEMTWRMDKSSTLPPSNNSYMYPSVSAGWVFTDALKINSDILTYGKLRASVSKVGNDAPPYQLQNVYASTVFGNNVASFNFPLGTTAGFGASSRIAPATLNPEFTTSREVGINLGLFKSRVTVDMAYFNQESKSQIINVGIAPSTGYATKTVNVGDMTNKGLEALVNIAPITTSDFRWDLSVNFTKIVNKVVSIAPGVTSFSIPGSAFIGSIPSIKVDYPYGVILGGVIPRSPDGQRIINPATGTYQPTIANQVLSDPNPDWTGGLTNNLRYKSLSLGFTFDYIKGGQILSFTSALYKSRGVYKPTGDNRDQPMILPGVIETSPGSGKYVQNNIQIPAQTYWQTVGGLQSEFNVYDATVLRLREVGLSYDFPQRIIKNMKINGIRLSIFANNVFFFAPFAIIDPQVNTQGAGNIRGLELQSAPSARTVGASIRLSL